MHRPRRFDFDPRRLKRHCRKTGENHPVYLAYLEGQALSVLGPRDMPPRLWSNPYPAGRRHDSWQRGYETADCRDFPGLHAEPKGPRS